MESEELEYWIYYEHVFGDSILLKNGWDNFTVENLKRYIPYKRKMKCNCWSKEKAINILIFYKHVHKFKWTE